MKNNFFTKFLEKSKTLRERFVVTTKNEWNPMSVLAELFVQIGHVFTVLKNSPYLEKDRKIDDLGDEMSDVVFQLIIIGNMYNFDFENLKKNPECNLTHYICMDNTEYTCLLSKGNELLKNDDNSYEKIHLNNKGRA